jgi:hypothetical protein
MGGVRWVQAGAGIGIVLAAAVVLLAGCSQASKVEWSPVPSATFTPTPDTAWGLYVEATGDEVSDWARVVPRAWRNPSEAFAHYGVYIEYTPQIIESCLYHKNDGPADFRIQRRQLEVIATVIDLQTQKVIHRETFGGDLPRECPDSTSHIQGAVNQVYVGSMPSIIKFEKWMLGLFLAEPGEYTLPPLTPSMTPTATRTLTPGPTLFWSPSVTPGATYAGPMALAPEEEF